MSKLKCAIAGTGGRALGLAKNILSDCSDLAEIVGLYDINPVRMQGFQKLLGHELPAFTDLPSLVQATKPNLLIVCTTDASHPDVIEQGFKLGLDVICEKPLAIDEKGILKILALEKQYGRKVRVAFNLRYSPYALKVRQIIKQGVLGKLLSVHAEWFIDRTHALEYFRRWHAYQEHSGGLYVHKASHHFDLLNWWIDRKPLSVCATGSLQIYGKAGPFRGPYCRVCEHRSHCWAAMRSETIEDTDLNPNSEGNIFRALYFNAEHVDGYRRDRCVFDPQIDIYDSMTAQIKYEQDLAVSYHLTAHSPYQGYRVVFNGSDGRLETERISPATCPPEQDYNYTLRLITGTDRKNVHLQNIELPPVTGSHDGGDDRMLRHLLDPGSPDPDQQTAGSLAGAASTLIGSCANKSCATGQWVNLPDYHQIATAGQKEAAAIA